MTLKVAVLIKQVPDLEARVRVDEGGTLDVEQRYVCSFFDEIAIEQALRIRETHAGAELAAFSAGGPRCVEALRRAVAMGIDDVRHVGDESLDGPDRLPTARALAAALAGFGPDLVLAGRAAGDDDAAAVGPMVAELMGMPHVGSAVALEVDPAAGTARATRRSGPMTLELAGALPLLATAERGLAEPRIPVVTRVMKAMKAQPTPVSLDGLGIDAAQGIERLGHDGPRRRPPVTVLPEPLSGGIDELVAQLQQRGVLS